MKVKKFTHLTKRIIQFAIISSLTVFVAIIFYLVAFSFRIEKEFKYRTIFQNSFQQRIDQTVAWKALGRGRIEFYSAGSEGICVVGLKRYNNVSIKNITIKNQDSGVRRVDFPEQSSSIRSDGFPFANIVMFPARAEIKNIDIFIKSRIEKIIRKDYYIYIKFIDTPVEFRSVEKYTEFNFTNISDPPLELMILKREGENLIIFKYGIDENKRGFTVPLTTMIDLK